MKKFLAFILLLGVFVTSSTVYSPVKGAYFLLEEDNGGGGSGAPYTVDVTIFAISDIIENASTSSNTSSVGSVFLGFLGINTSGHAWLEVTNNYSCSITVGQMTVGAYESVTLGTYGNKDHEGLYYNLEYYYEETLTDAYLNRVSYTETFSITDLVALNEFIIDNDEWAYNDNCSNFAISTWNELSATDFAYSSPYTTPSTLINQIWDLDYLSNAEINGNINNVGYYNEETFIYSTT